MGILVPDIGAGIHERCQEECPRKAILAALNELIPHLSELFYAA
jgi:hypothetical protein